MEPMYWKPEPRRYPPYLRRWITRGRGIGRGSAYRPWLTVRDVPSRGTSFKIAGIKIKRVFQVFSEQEATYLFLSERNPKVVDIRENWPILDIDWTLQACKAVSGMGKTTFISSFLLGYPQIIRHTQYHGRKLKCHQIVYLVLRVPHDATLKSLCLQFFDKVDHLLGTNYLRQARGLRQIAPMVHLMNQVATATSLGFIVIDDIQNLRSAKGGNAEIVLNVFSEIIEGLGISLLVLATPAVQTVLEKNVRNVRKITSSGMTVIEPMKKDDGQWDLFCDRCWGYTFLKNKPALSKSIRDAWFGASAGNTAFVILAFMLSQRSEIGGCETLDAAAFERTAAKEMAFLQPANAALRSGKPGDLQQFDDLLFDDRFIELRRLLGLVEEPPSLTRDGFDGEHDRGRDKRSTAKSLRPPADWHGNENLPTEDPLAV